MTKPHPESGIPSVSADIDRAVSILKVGGLVAFPTETVYGLGADAENEAAVRRIFHVKGRPSDNPLIVHLAGKECLEDWAAGVTTLAWKLADRFWPGPLTLILRRVGRVPLVVTGGSETVGLRVPDQPLALALLRAFGRGVAAPSANKFGRTSPTTAEHVREDLDDSVDFILDGGPCRVGIESTIVDFSSDEPAILRPGGVSREMIESVLGFSVPVRSGGKILSPGQYRSHYAPRARVILSNLEGLPEAVHRFLSQGYRVGVLAPSESQNLPREVVRISLPSEPSFLARHLYVALREMDHRQCDIVLAVLPPEEGLGLAIADRLRRAAGEGNIVKGEKVA